MSQLQALTVINATPIFSLTKRSSTCSSKLNTSLEVRISFLPTNNASVEASIALSPVSRRNMIASGIASAILGLNIDERDAWAAARRPPPPPTNEKKDPNISGVQAKILASKRRKEAMKQAVAEQRERGKKIQDSKNSTLPPPPSEPPS